MPSLGQMTGWHRQPLLARRASSSYWREPHRLIANTQMTIAVMVTVTTATIIAQKIIGRRSFFVWALERRGVTLTDASEQEIMLATTSESAVSEDFELLPKSASIRETRELIVKKRPVVDDLQDRKVLGIMYRKDLMLARSDATDEGEA